MTKTISCDINSNTVAGGRRNPLPLSVSLLRAEGVSLAPSALGSKLFDGWHGTTFVSNGKKFVVAISPEIGKNGLHELHTYRFDDDEQAAPSEKLTRIVTEPLKPLAVSKYTGGNSLMAETAGKKCAFCQKLVSWGNKKMKYCSDACRTAAYRRRKEAVKA